LNNLSELNKSCGHEIIVFDEIVGGKLFGNINVMILNYLMNKSLKLCYEKYLKLEEENQS
jgi:hypothetical protein